MIQLSIKIFILLSVAKFISLVFLYFLPSDGVEQKMQNDYTPKYHRVDFKNMLDNSKKETNNVVHTTNTTVLTSMILKGLFGNSSSGYAIIALKSSPKNTTILSIGDEYKGYTLKSILTNGVILVKNSKEYILKMKTAKTSNSFISKIKPKEDEVFKQTKVAKSDINYYTSHPKEVWRDIGLKRVENPKGFKVTMIKKGSKIDALGLKKGDVIIKANNISLKSLKNVMKIYKDIKNITTMEIVVIRDHKEVELVYEID